MIYTAKAHTTGGREEGASRTSDGRLDVKLTTPGTKGDGTNPEQLFAVGWSSCFLSAIKIVATRTKVKLPADVAVDAEVDLGTTDGQYLVRALSACQNGSPTCSSEMTPFEWPHSPEYVDRQARDLKKMRVAQALGK